MKMTKNIKRGMLHEYKFYNSLSEIMIECRCTWEHHVARVIYYESLCGSCLLISHIEESFLKKNWSVLDIYHLIAEFMVMCFIEQWLTGCNQIEFSLFSEIILTSQKPALQQTFCSLQTEGFFSVKLVSLKSKKI